MRVPVKKNTRVIHGNKQLQSALVEAAWGATRRKEGHLKKFYQKLLVRKGSKKALVAVSHKIIIATYFILKNKEAYKEPLLQNKNANKRRFKKQFAT
jgi:hypothetical protein